MLPLSSLMAGLSQGAAAFSAAPYLAGARVFHAAEAGEQLWIADLSRFDSNGSPLAHNLFVSADGSHFHQLRVVERLDGLILTDTPGFLPALAVYREEDRGMAFILGDRTHPSEGVRILLDRVPAKILQTAHFFSPAPSPAGVSRSKEGPRVRAAERDREPDRRILSVQSRVAALDRGREHLKEYVVTRGLEEASAYAAVTSFGPIVEKVGERLGSLSAYRSNPVRLLTVGPGQGRMEAELNARFDGALRIDTFALTDAVAPENWEDFQNLYVGNLDTHRLPEGYDFVLSFYGSSYAVDQRRVLAQILDALNPDGEALFLVTGEMIAGYEPDLLPRDEIEALRKRYGIVYETSPHPAAALRNGILVESVFLRKPRGCPPARNVFEPPADMREHSRQAWEAFQLVAKSRDRELDPALTELDLARFRERLAYKRRYWSRQGHETAIQTVLFAWAWIEGQGVLIKR